MSKQVKWRRGTTAEHSTFTGAIGEVTVDTTKRVVVVHDGVTLGGLSVTDVAENMSGRVFTSVDRMMLATDLKVGSTVAWGGYYEAGDGGGNKGIVKAGVHTHDGGKIFTITPTLYVEAALETWVDTRKFGVKHDFYMPDGITVNPESTDNHPMFQAACNASLRVVHAAAGSARLGKYVQLRSHHHVTLDGGIVNTLTPSLGAPMYHVGGFDAQEKTGIRIDGQGILQSEGLVPQPDVGFQIHQETAYCPIIHLRACSDSVVQGVVGYKLAMGVACSINSVASQPTWSLVPLVGVKCKNIRVVDCHFKYVSFFSVTLNTVQGGEMSRNYCYRSGDSGLHAMYSSNLRIMENHRESPFGDGSMLDDSRTGILTQNDVQGISIENCQNVVCSNNTLIGFMGYSIDVKNASQNVLVSDNMIMYGQLAGITSRGGDNVYERCTAITIAGNTIKNQGYKHTTHTVWINHPYRGGIFVNDTYSVFVKSNTFIGFNSTYARSPIVCEGVLLEHLGFWSDYSVTDRLSYTALVVNDNTVTLPQARTNYPRDNPSDPIDFEAADCATSGIVISGIWGKVQVNSNSLLSHNLVPARSTTSEVVAGIQVTATGAETVGQSSIQSIEVSDNTITSWFGGGILIDGINHGYPTPAAVNISSNTIHGASNYGIHVKNLSSPCVHGNKISECGTSVASTIRHGIVVTATALAIVSSNVVRTRQTAMYVSAIKETSSSVQLIANILQAGSSGSTLGTGFVRGGNDQSAGVYGGTNWEF